MKKKTICIVIGGHFAAGIGGSQYQAKCIVDCLKDTGRFNIYYLARSLNASYQPQGYRVLQIAKPGGIRRYTFAIDALKLHNLLRELNPDVIYQRGLKAYTGIAAYFAKHHRCRSVFHISSDHSLLPGGSGRSIPAQWLRAVDERFERYGLRYVDTIIAQTKHQAMLLESRFGRDADAIIPNFHPLPHENIAKTSGKLRVIWVANFKQVKQPEIFVQLARDLNHRDDLEFVMIGRPGDPVRYRDLHVRILQTPNLTFTGELPIEEVNQQLALGHLFVNTSRYEGFPNTFIQAWMRRVPTLSLSVDPDGLLSTQSIGYCAGTYENLRSKILELADGPEARERMAQAAQQYAFEAHSPRAAERLVRILEGVAEH